jgi:hypothetical protein
LRAGTQQSQSAVANHLNIPKPPSRIALAVEFVVLILKEEKKAPRENLSYPRPPGFRICFYGNRINLSSQALPNF